MVIIHPFAPTETPKMIGGAVRDLIEKENGSL
jgi:hypothetical protein